MKFVLITESLPKFQISRSLERVTKNDMEFSRKTKHFQSTWTFCFLAGTVFLSQTITVFTTVLCRRRVAIPFPKLHTSATRCTTSRIIRLFSKSTNYRTWLDRTFTCFSPLTTKVSATICWSWPVTLSCTTFNSNTTRLRAF